MIDVPRHAVKPKRGQREGSIREVAPGRWQGELTLAGERPSVSGARRRAVVRGVTGQSAARQRGAQRPAGARHQCMEVH